MGHARAMLPLEGAQQILVAGEVVAKKMSVRETERLVAKTAQARPQTPQRAPKDKARDLLRIEQELSDKLTAPVEIRIKKRTLRGEQGEIALAFGSLDELNGLLERLGLGAT
jgi:ParB family chromosome partitioning protein